MTIILNEVKYAEEMYSNGDLGSKPVATLNVIARYLRQKKMLKPRAIKQELNSFMENNYPNYNPDLWESRIEKMVAASKKYPLREIDGVGITQTELDIIARLPTLKHRQIVFAFLCCAKFYNAATKENHDWANVNFIDAFKIAGVKTRNREEKCRIIYELSKGDILDGGPPISLSKRNTNTNVKVMFVDYLSDPVLWIADFRELGKEYLAYCNPDDYYHCELCGGVIQKKGRKRSKYCAACARDENRRRARERKMVEKV